MFTRSREATHAASPAKGARAVALLASAALLSVSSSAAAGGCPPDLDGDGDVGFPDFLAILTADGPCDGCPEDLSDDGVVDNVDLMYVLECWGPERDEKGRQIYAGSSIRTLTEGGWRVAHFYREVTEDGHRFHYLFEPRP